MIKADGDSEQTVVQSERCYIYRCCRAVLHVDFAVLDRVLALEWQETAQVLRPSLHIEISLGPEGFGFYSLSVSLSKIPLTEEHTHGHVRRSCQNG